ncbi:MAG: hypothetical protein ABEK59_01320 [Halobacteria archaeon]
MKKDLLAIYEIQTGIDSTTVIEAEKPISIDGFSGKVETHIEVEYIPENFAIHPTSFNEYLEDIDSVQSQEELSAKIFSNIDEALDTSEIWVDVKLQNASTTKNVYLKDVQGIHG